ncbi:MAG: Asr1405/Asl0597 family protein [Prochloraceae cyanobacterium]
MSEIEIILLSIEVMSCLEPSSVINHVIVVKGSARWEIYRRLQELQIPCQCGYNQPLQVQIESPTTAIQLWSVFRHSSVSRDDLVSWLEGCWRMKTREKES